MIQRFLLLGGTALLASSLAVSSAEADLAIQSTTQTYDFLPWQGCWQAEGAPNGELLCILTDRSGGMRMITVQNGETVAESRIIADGRSRPVEQAECKGTEQARWSADRQRLFLSSDLTCSENVARNANGLFVFTGPREWISVQSVNVGDQTAVRTTRYTQAEMDGVPAAIRSALINGSSTRVAAIESVLQTVDENDVNEAVRYLDAAVVQEWLQVTDLPYAIAGANDGDSPAQAPYTSALDQVGRMSNPSSSVERGVHVVERPTVVHHHTYVTHVVRSCWDPFWGGYCGHRYYSSYSPWGYDPFRWRVVFAPFVIVRNSPIIIRRSPRGHYHRGPFVYRDRDRDHDRDDDWRGGRATRSGYSSGDRDRRSGDRNQNQSGDRNVARGVVVHSDPVRASSSIDRTRTVSPGTSVERTPTVSRGSSDIRRAVPRSTTVDRSSSNRSNSSVSPSSGSSNRSSASRSSSSTRGSERTSSPPRRATARSSRGN
jgi:hypothetical protein